MMRSLGDDGSVGMGVVMTDGIECASKGATGLADTWDLWRAIYWGGVPAEDQQLQVYNNLEGALAGCSGS